MNKTLKIILVDDHAVVRAGFRMLLQTEAGIEVIAEAERGEQACQLYFDLQPDVLVIDLSMPGIGGLETIRRIINRDAQAKILVFSVHNERVYIDRAMNAGACGYITKSSAPGILVKAIQALNEGKIYIEQGLVNFNQSQLHSIDYQTKVETLSAREFDVFLLLAKGLTVQKIATELCLGYKTVANYGTQIRNKFQVSTVAELAQIAQVLGMIKN